MPRAGSRFATGNAGSDALRDSGVALDERINLATKPEFERVVRELNEQIEQFSSKPRAR